MSQTDHNFGSVFHKRRTAKHLPASMYAYRYYKMRAFRDAQNAHCDWNAMGTHYAISKYKYALLYATHMIRKSILKGGYKP